MAEIKSQEQFEKVRDALKAGQFDDDPAVRDEVLAAAESWKSSQNKEALSQTMFGGFPSVANAFRKTPETLTGLSDFLLQAGSSALSTPVSGLEGVATGSEVSSIPQVETAAGGRLRTGGGPPPISFGFNNDRANEALGNRSEALTYQPRTESGQRISGAVANALGKVDLAIDDAAMGLTNDSPGAAAFLKTVALGVPEALGAKGIAGAARRGIADTPSPAQMADSGIAPAALPNELPAPTTTQGLFREGSAAFERAREAGSAIEPTSAAKFRESLGTLREKNGSAVIINNKLHPASSAALKEIGKLTEGDVSFDSLIQARQLASDAAGTLDKADARIAMKIRDAIDDYVDNLDADDMIGGDPKQAAASLKEARNLWGRARNAEFFERLIEKAQNDVAANYSQAGFETALKRRVKNVLNSDSQVRRFPDEIKKAMQEVVDGSPVSNFLRKVGKMAPRGVVSGGFIMGATALNPVLGGVLYGAGELSKRAAEASTIGRVNNIVDVARRGGLLDQ